MRRYIKKLRGAALFVASLTRQTTAVPFKAGPLFTRGRDHLKTHGSSYLKHAPLFLALWSVRRAHPVVLAYTLGKTGLELASDPKIRAAVAAARQKLRRG